MNLKNNHAGVLLLLKLQAEAYDFTKRVTLPWMFFAFFKLCKWYQIAQSVTNVWQFPSYACVLGVIFDKNRTWKNSLKTT